MKNISTLKKVVLFVLTLAVVFAVAAFAYAQTQDDVIVEWVSDKETYEANEGVKLKLIITNNTSEQMRFTYSVEIPDVVGINDGPDYAGVFAIGTDVTEELRWEKVIKTTVPGTSGGVSTRPTQPTQPSGSTDTEPGASDDASGNVVTIILWVVLAVAVIAALVFVIIKRRGVTAMIAVILCAGILVPMMAPLEAGATSDVETITAEKTITIAGETVTLKATVTCEVYEARYEVAEDGIRVYEAEAGRLMFEAEDQVLPGQDRLVVRENEYASGGAEVYMAKAAEDKDDDGQPDYADYSETLPAQMSFRFVADTEGDYAVWARVYASSSAISMIVSVNGEKYKYTRLVETVPENETVYGWSRILTIACEPGDEVDVRIRSRHMNGQIDKFIITDNIAYVPSGMGTLPSQLYWDKVTEFDTDAFADPVLYPTEGQHPRLMFTEADIPGILERLNHPDNEAARVEFDKKRGTDFDGILEDIEDGSNYNANYLAVIEAKAFDYAIHKNSDNKWKQRTALVHGEEAVSCMINFLQTVTFSGTGMDYRYIGATLFTVAEVYDWCFDLLDEEEMDLLVAGAQIQASMIEAGFPPSTIEALAFNGHDAEYQIQQCWLAFAIAVADEYPSIYDFIAGMYFDLYIDTRNAWYPSGAYHQGSAYGTYRFDADMWGQWLIYQMTGGDNDLDGDGEADGYRVFTEDAAKVIYQWIYSRRPDGKIMTEGDDYEMTQTNDNTWFDSLKSIMFNVANFYDDPLLYQEMLRENPGLVPGSATTIYSPVMILILNDPDTMDASTENTEVGNLPLSTYLPEPYAGMIARTGWEWGMTSDDTVVTMQLAQRLLGGHQHQDTGSFQIYYKGLLSGDSGYYVNMGVDHDANYARLSVAHNTLSITSKENPTGVQIDAFSVEDLLMPSEQSKYLRSKVLGQEYGPNIYTPEYTYLAGDIAGAYDANVLEAVRSMLFLNLELDGNTEYPGAFIVFDQIKTAESGSTKSFLLHATTRPTVEGNAIIIENTEEGYNGKLVNQVLYVGTEKAADPNYKIVRIGGENKEFWYNGKNHPNESTLADNCAYEPGWGRLEISTTSKVGNQTDYMLNVMYVSDADGSLEVVPATLIQGDGIMGAQIFNHVAMFNMDGNNRIEKTVTFTIPASADYKTFKVNVAGVKAGTWTVTVNGQSKDYVASEDGGMLYFEASAGKVTVTRKNNNSDKTFDTVDHREPVEDILLFNLNNNYRILDTKPIKSGDTVLIPALEIFKELEGIVERNGAVVNIQYMGTQTIVIDTAKKTATVNGKEIEVSELRMVGEELMVDVETFELILTEDFGEAKWDPRAKCAYVTARAPSYIPEEKRPFDNTIQVEDVYLTDEKNTNVDTSDSSGLINTLDNSTTSYTAMAGYLGEAGAVYDLGEVYTLETIWLMFGHCQTRIYTFEILVSTDGINFEALSGGKRFKSEKTKELYTWQEYTMPEDLRVRYVKLVGYGNEPDNDWFNWQEIVFIGVPVQEGKVISSGGTTVYDAIDGNTVTTLSNGASVEVVRTQVVNGTAWGKISWNGDYAWVRMAHIVLYADEDAKVQETGKVVASKTDVYNIIWADAAKLGQLKSGTEVNILKTQTVDSVSYALVNYEGYQGWIKMSDLAFAADPDEFTTATGSVTATDGAKVYNRSSLSAIFMGLLPKGTPIDIYQTKDVYGVIYGRITYEGLEAWVNLADVDVHDPNPPFYMEIEAENVMLYEGTDSSMQANGQVLSSNVLTVAEDANASGGKVVQLPWGGRFATGTVTGNTDLSVNPAHLSFTVEADRSGTYFVWVRYYTKADTATVSSYIDGIVYRGTSTTTATGWQYDMMGDDDYNSIVADGYVWYRLAICEWMAGESYTVRLRGRDGNLSYDKFIVTTDPTFTPCAEDSMTAVETDQVIEAESVTRNPLLSDTVADDTLDSGSKVLLERPYLNDDLFVYSTGGAPAISFKTTADKAGTYYIWGRFTKFSTMYASISGYGSDYTYKYYKPDQKMTAEIEGWYLIGTYEVGEAGESIYVRMLGRHTGNEVDQFYVTMDSTFVGVKPHEHTYSKEWTTDEHYHWHVANCGHAGLISDKGEHVYSNDEDTSCNTCGYVRKLHPHTFSEEWTSDNRYHWHAATCGCLNRVSDKAEHTFNEDNVCTVCQLKKVYFADESLIYIEAEKVTLYQGKDPSMLAGTQVLGNDVLTVAEDANASGGYAVKLTWGGRFASGTVFGSTDLTAIPAHLSFSVEPEKTGTYYVWVRYHSDTAKPTLATYIDGNIFCNSAATTGTGWMYEEMGDDDYNSSLSGGYIWYRLAICEWEAEQTYTVRVRARDGKLSYDQFIVTADAGFAPNMEELNAAETEKVIEAEEVSCNPLFTDTVTENGVTYIETEKNHKYDSLYAAAECYSATPALGFKVTAEKAGTYYIWGKFGTFDTMYAAISSAGTAYAYKYYKPNQNQVAVIDGWYLIGTYEATAGECIEVRLFGRTGTAKAGNANRIDQFYVTADSEFVGVKPHEHTYSTNWSQDASYHWHAATCGHAELVADKQAHIYDDDLDTTCNTCGYIRQVHAHTFSDVWTSDDTYHWYAATCGCLDKVSDKAEHSFGADRLCTVCGAKRVYIAGNGLLSIEAEDADVFTAEDPTMSNAKPAELAEHSAASGGKVVQWTWTANLSYAQYTTANATDLTAFPAHISFPVQAGATGTYFVWARVAVDDTTNIWTYIDGNVRNSVNSTLTGEGWKYDIWGSADYCSSDETPFIWVRIGVCNWEEGNTYNVRLRARNGRRVIVDRFVVTMDNSYAPFLGDGLASFNTDTIIEAEDTSLDMSRVAIEGSVVFIDKYMQIESDYLNAKGAPGSINFQVTAAAPGTYYIWAKMTSKSSLYYAFGDSAYKGVWPSGTGWQKIGSYTVTETGEIIVIRLLGRQANNKIDQFYVTADSNWKGQ